MAGELTPEQFQQLMYMHALSGMNGPNFSPTSSGMGAMGQAVSPLVQMLMMQRMMPQQATGPVGGGNPMMPPGGAPGLGAALSPYGAGAGGPIGGGNPMMSPMALAPQPSGLVMPPLPGGGIGGAAPLANTSGLTGNMGIGGLGY